MRATSADDAAPVSATTAGFAVATASPMTSTLAAIPSPIVLTGPTRFAPRVDAVRPETVPATRVESAPEAEAPEAPAAATASATKRLVDCLMAATLVLILSPVFLLVTVLIAVTSRGPALIVQERVGLRGQRFGMLKFRTMIDGAEEHRAEVIGAPDDDIVDRYRDDPRITTVGRLLRRWSIDELPQLFNVLGGSMSMVGPRPILPEELPYLDSDSQRRHDVKPGLTGLWQVSGRKSVCWEERMRLDLQYVDQWSPRMDLHIIACTLNAIVAGGGAF